MSLKNLRPLLILLFTTFHFFIPVSAWALSLQANVVSIHDGDTLKIDIGEDKPRTVRMIGLDTPEIDFNGHTQGDIAFEARDYLRSILPIGATVAIEVEGDDGLSSRRLLGTVIYKNVNINKQMLSSGYGIHYFIFPFDMDRVEAYRDAVIEAKEARRGTHRLSKKEYQQPYDFRLSMSGRRPTNHIGDLSNFKLYKPDEGQHVEPENKVFFKYPNDAHKLGFQ